MNRIKIKMINDLFTMLHDCNMAGVQDFDDKDINDLPGTCSRQHSTFGHIGDAIKSLGYSTEYWRYCETGDRPNITA